MVGEERAVAVRDEDYSDAIGRNMRAAWLQIKKAQTRMWSQWMTVGEGLMEGRRWAMAQAGVNRPEGKGYNTALSEWLTRYGVSDMDASDRAKLLQLMEERPAIEEWRATLTDHERRSLNNPTLVWRKWNAMTQGEEAQTAHRFLLGGGDGTRARHSRAAAGAHRRARGGADRFQGADHRAGERASRCAEEGGAMSQVYFVSRA